MSHTLWFYVVGAIALSSGLWHFTKRYERSLITSILGCVILCAASFAGFQIAVGSMTDDIEILNGEVLAKERIHDKYDQSYECNCTTTGSGSSARKTCGTCYETHYTVEWKITANVETWTIDKLDSTSTSVYHEPNPHQYNIINVGDPFSSRHSYTNYLQAVPDNVISVVRPALQNQFKFLIPTYPDSLNDHHQASHFVSPGFSFDDAQQWEDELKNTLKRLGPAKQANIIVVVAKTSDTAYVEALKSAWQGANKNDVVVVIGSSKAPTIDFVRVITWAKSATFKRELEETLLTQGSINRQQVITTISSKISQSFERRHMKDFEYLQETIDPPAYMLVLIALAMIAIAAYLYGHIIGVFDGFYSIFFRSF